VQKGQQKEERFFYGDRELRVHKTQKERIDGRE